MMRNMSRHWLVVYPDSVGDSNGLEINRGLSDPDNIALFHWNSGRAIAQERGNNQNHILLHDEYSLRRNLNT